MPNDQEIYKFMYKCRYCGEKFYTSCTIQTIGIQHLLSFAFGKGNDRDDLSPGELFLHRTDDHIGIADFIGCKIERKAENG